MNVRDMVGVLAVAGATTALMVVLLGPSRVGATDEPAGITPLVAQPTLTTQGCLFALKTDQPAYAPGEKPVLEIEGTNATDQPVEATVWVSIWAASPPSPFARVVLPTPAPSTPLWVEKCLVSLEPGETKTVTLATEVPLPEGAMVTITMSDKEATVQAGSISTPAPVLLQQAPNQSGAAARIAL